MSQEKNRTMSLYTATCLVVANMVGVGVFTSLGYQIGGLTPFVILVLWLVGGVCAFCGGVAYAELAAALPRSGGEYHFLTRIFHPSVGFLAGWVSITAGFAAPVALGAMAFGNYIHRVNPDLPALPLAFAALAFITVAMLASARLRHWFQNVSTSISFLAILVFLAIGFFAPVDGSALAPQAGDTARMFSKPFATSLVYVMFAYAGWNASTYVTAEVRNPSRNVPLSMAIGTVIVTVIYIAMNAIFLRAAPAAELAGQNEVGLIAGTHVFGVAGGKWMGLLIAGGLLAHIGSMQWIGPRVTATMGEDNRLLRPLAQVNAGGIPIYASFVQTGVAAFMIATGTFQSVLTYVQFTITLCSALVVLGVFVLRVREPNLPRPIRAWGYPITPAIFLIVNGWMVWYVLLDKPRESLVGLATILSGLVVYFLSGPRKK